MSAPYRSLLAEAEVARDAYYDRLIEEHATLSVVIEDLRLKLPENLKTLLKARMAAVQDASEAWRTAAAALSQISADEVTP